MIKYTTTIYKFGQKGEKTGWSYILINSHQAEQLKPGQRTSFRVKGKLDQVTISKAALIPMGDGEFILPLKADMRKKLGKEAGEKISVSIEADDRPLVLSPDFVRCLHDEPGAWEFFKTLPKSHQHYFSNWIESAKTMTTKSKRITMAVIALASKQGYGEMIRANKTIR